MSEVLIQLDWQAGGVNEPSQQLLVVHDAFTTALHVMGQFVEVAGTSVGERIGLQPTPKILDRVELRSVGRQRLDMQPVMLVDELPHASAAMNRKPIPNKHHMTA